MHSTIHTQAERLAAVIESLLLITDQPLSLKRMKEVLDIDDDAMMKAALALIRQNAKLPGRGIELVEVANGYLLKTPNDHASWILKLKESKPQRLSRAALETLAIVAYKQPITRPEIEEIRGVDSGGVMKTLLDKELIRILGKREDSGNPLIYGTTEFFLNFFGVKSLSELPSLKDYQALQEAELELPLVERSEERKESEADGQEVKEEVAEAAAESETVEVEEGELDREPATVPSEFSKEIH